MRILVVDDSKVARAVLKKILGEIGYETVAEARDGVEALEAIQEAAFDLVITDWNMPNLDGLGLVKEIHGAAIDLPVLMVSSESYFNRIVDVMQAGAAGYIRKPFAADTLAAKIREVLKKRELSEHGVATLNGRLDEIGFPELIQFLTSCRRNGRVHIQVGALSGTLDLRDGEVKAAAWNDESGDDAVFAMVEHDHGTFRFQPADDEVEANVTMPTMPLLIEAMRRRDERVAHTSGAK